MTDTISDTLREHLKTILSNTNLRNDFAEPYLLNHVLQQSQLLHHYLKFRL